MGSGIGDVPTSGNIQRGFLKLNLFHLEDFCDKEYCSALETDFFFFLNNHSISSLLCKLV